MQYFAFGMPGPVEWIIILAIVVILFGVGKLPKVLGQMGKGVKAFKEGMLGKMEDGDEDQIDVTPDDASPALEAAQIEEADEVSPPPSPSIHDAVTSPSLNPAADAADADEADADEAPNTDPAPNTDLHDAVTEPGTDEFKEGE